MIRALQNTISTKTNLLFQGIFGVLLASTLLVRLLNLNYNSPFADEAIYVVIGRLGLFQNDWVTYNPASWLAGLPYLYPSIAALTYVIGGITASRLFNILLNVLLVAVVFKLTTRLFTGKSEEQKLFAGAIAALIAGGASVGIWVSRLATYDMPSFFFFLVSLYFLLKAEDKTETHGRNYFYSGFFLFLATMTKIIIGAYVPFVFAYAWLKAKSLPKKNRRFWLIYFLMPLLIGFGLYALTQTSFLLSYAGTSAAREKETFTALLSALWQHTKYVIPFFILGSVGMLLKKDFKKWAAFTGLSLIVLLPHFLTQRALPTMEKQTYLTIALLAPVIGIGITYLFSYVKFAAARLIFGLVVLFSLGGYWYANYQEVLPYNVYWQDIRPYSDGVRAHVAKDDKILSESGMPFILDAYDYIYPHNVTTYDYISYRGRGGYDAYAEAVKDGYFDVIQLSDSKEVVPSTLEMRKIIINNFNDNYKLAYRKNDYLIYKRVF